MATSFLGAGLAKHPPLELRIRAIDPGWDGRFRQGITPVIEALAASDAH